MSTATLSAPIEPDVPSVVRKPVLSVFLPKEHGSWSLVLEPLALGLLVAPSRAGEALALAALAGFFARRPIKALVASAANRRPGVGLAAALFSAVAAGAFAIVFVLGGLMPLWPLLVAVPLAALFAWFDAQNESRVAAAEVIGSAAFAVMPVVFATLAGWSAGPALALGGLALTRSLPTVLTVRCALRRAKGETTGFGLPLFAAGIAASAVSVAAAFHFVPVSAALTGWVLFARTWWFASPSRPAWPARRIGMFEALLGLLYVGAIAITYHL